MGEAGTSSTVSFCAEAWNEIGECRGLDAIFMTEAIASSPCVLICQGRTCKKQGSVAVLKLFQAFDLTGWTITTSSCMGQCGNGPMVRVLPDNVWYWQVKPDEVSTIAQKHLIGGQPVRGMLYPTLHS